MCGSKLKEHNSWFNSGGYAPPGCQRHNLVLQKTNVQIQEHTSPERRWTTSAFAIMAPGMVCVMDMCTCARPVKNMHKCDSSTQPKRAYSKRQHAFCTHSVYMNTSHCKVAGINWKVDEGDAQQTIILQRLTRTRTKVLFRKVVEDQADRKFLASALSMKIVQPKQYDCTAALM